MCADLSTAALAERACGSVAIAGARGAAKGLHAGPGTACAIARRPAYEAPSPSGYHRRAMAGPISSVPLEQQLQEIGAQLAWVRDYL